MLFRNRLVALFLLLQQQEIVFRISFPPITTDHKTPAIAPAGDLVKKKGVSPAQILNRVSPAQIYRWSVHPSVSPLATNSHKSKSQPRKNGRRRQWHRHSFIDAISLVTILFHTLVGRSINNSNDYGKSSHTIGVWSPHSHFCDYWKVFPKVCFVIVTTINSYYSY